ncbi:MAG: MFS transporter, partial [Firmicutes bacterium]|nr:MFS transporter [Bacillota bacterium]
INYFSIKDVEFIQKPTTEKMDGLISTYINLLKLKPMTWFIPWVFFILLGTAVATANVEYVIIYTAGLPASVISQTSATTLVCFLVGAPLLTWVATKWDRKNAVIIGYVISIVCLIGVKILGIDSLFDIFLLQGVTGIATVAFWVFFYDFSYDLIELDEYQNRKNRAGAITSFPQLVQKVGNAVGLQLIGIMLTLVGFDAAKGTAQSAQTLVGIENIATFFVAGCMLVSLICVIKYPINKGLYEKLQAANEKRRAGEEDFYDADVDAIL